MFVAVAAEMLTCTAVSLAARTALVQHLTRQLHTDSVGLLNARHASAALLGYLQTRNVDPAHVAWLVEHGDPTVNAAAAAHPATPTRVFRRTLTSPPAGVAAGAVSGWRTHALTTAAAFTTDPRRLVWMLRTADPSDLDTSNLLLTVAALPAARLTPAVTVALLTTLNAFQHQHHDGDLVDIVDDRLSSSLTPARMSVATAALLRSGVEPHPSLLDAFVTAENDLTAGDLVHAAAAAFLAAADTDRPGRIDSPAALAAVLTHPALNPRTRARLVEHVAATSSPGDPLAALLGPRGPQDPAVITDCADGDAVRTLATFWWPLPTAHTVALAAHPAVDDVTAWRLVASQPAAAAAMFTTGRPTPTFRALMWLHQSRTGRVPVDRLTLDDLVAVLKLVGDDVFLTDDRRHELADRLATLAVAQVRKLPWPAALAGYHLDATYRSRLIDVLAPVMTPTGLDVLARIEATDATVEDVVAAVTTAGRDAPSPPEPAHA